MAVETLAASHYGNKYRCKLG